MVQAANGTFGMLSSIVEEGDRMLYPVTDTDSKRTKVTEDARLQRYWEDSIGPYYSDILRFVVHIVPNMEKPPFTPDKIEKRLEEFLGGKDDARALIQEKLLESDEAWRRWYGGYGGAFGGSVVPPNNFGGLVYWLVQYYDDVRSRSLHVEQEAIDTVDADQIDFDEYERVEKQRAYWRVLEEWFKNVGSNELRMVERATVLPPLENNPSNMVPLGPSLPDPKAIEELNAEARRIKTSTNLKMPSDEQLKKLYDEQQKIEKQFLNQAYWYPDTRRVSNADRTQNAFLASYPGYRGLLEQSMGGGYARADFFALLYVAVAAMMRKRYAAKMDAYGKEAEALARTEATKKREPDQRVHVLKRWPKAIPFLDRVDPGRFGAVQDSESVETELRKSAWSWPVDKETGQANLQTPGESNGAAAVIRRVMVWVNFHRFLMPLGMRGRFDIDLDYVSPPVTDDKSNDTAELFFLGLTNQHRALSMRYWSRFNGTRPSLGTRELFMTESDRRYPRLADKLLGNSHSGALTMRPWSTRYPSGDGYARFPVYTPRVEKKDASDMTDGTKTNPYLRPDPTLEPQWLLPEGERRLMPETQYRAAWRDHVNGILGPGNASGLYDATQAKGGPRHESRALLYDLWTMRRMTGVRFSAPIRDRPASQPLGTPSDVDVISDADWDPYRDLSPEPLRWDPTDDEEDKGERYLVVPTATTDDPPRTELTVFQRDFLAWTERVVHGGDDETPTPSERPRKSKSRTPSTGVPRAPELDALVVLCRKAFARANARFLQKLTDPSSKYGNLKLLVGDRARQGAFRKRPARGDGVYEEVTIAILRVRSRMRAASGNGTGALFEKKTGMLALSPTAITDALLGAEAVLGYFEDLVSMRARVISRAKRDTIAGVDSNIDEALNLATGGLASELFTSTIEAFTSSSLKLYSILFEFRSATKTQATKLTTDGYFKKTYEGVGVVRKTGNATKDPKVQVLPRKDYVPKEVVEATVEKTLSDLSRVAEGKLVERIKDDVKNNILVAVELRSPSRGSTVVGGVGVDANLLPASETYDQPASEQFVKSGFYRALSSRKAEYAQKLEDSAYYLEGTVANGLASLDVQSAQRVMESIRRGLGPLERAVLKISRDIRDNDDKKEKYQWLMDTYTALDPKPSKKGSVNIDHEATFARRIEVTWTPLRRAREAIRPGTDEDNIEIDALVLVRDTVGYRSDMADKLVNAARMATRRAEVLRAAAEKVRVDAMTLLTTHIRTTKATYLRSWRGVRNIVSVLVLAASRGFYSASKTPYSLNDVLSWMGVPVTRSSSAPGSRDPESEKPDWLLDAEKRARDVYEEKWGLAKGEEKQAWDSLAIFVDSLVSAFFNVTRVSAVPGTMVDEKASMQSSELLPWDLSASARDRETRFFAITRLVEHASTQWRFPLGAASHEKLAAMNTAALRDACRASMVQIEPIADLVSAHQDSAQSRASLVNHVLRECHLADLLVLTEHSAQTKDDDMVLRNLQKAGYVSSGTSENELRAMLATEISYDPRSARETGSRKDVSDNVRAALRKDPLSYLMPVDMTGGEEWSLADMAASGLVGPGGEDASTNVLLAGLMFGFSVGGGAFYGSHFENSTKNFYASWITRTAANGEAIGLNAFGGNLEDKKVIGAHVLKARYTLSCMVQGACLRYLLSLAMASTTSTWKDSPDTTMSYQKLLLKLSKPETVIAQPDSTSGLLPRGVLFADAAGSRAPNLDWVEFWGGVGQTNVYTRGTDPNGFEFSDAKSKVATLGLRLSSTRQTMLDLCSDTSREARILRRSVRLSCRSLCTLEWAYTTSDVNTVKVLRNDIDALRLLRTVGGLREAIRSLETSLPTVSSKVIEGQQFVLAGGSKSQNTVGNILRSIIRAGRAVDAELKDRNVTSGTRIDLNLVKDPLTARYEKPTDVSGELNKLTVRLFAMKRGDVTAEAERYQGIALREINSVIEIVTLAPDSLLGDSSQNKMAKTTGELADRPLVSNYLMYEFRPGRDSPFRRGFAFLGVEPRHLFGVGLASNPAPAMFGGRLMYVDAFVIAMDEIADTVMARIGDA